MEQRICPASIIGWNSFISIILYSKVLINKIRCWDFKRIVKIADNLNRYDNNQYKDQ